MKNFFATLQHIWKIEDLRKRILLTLALILIYRVGSFVILPGVNAEAMSNADVGGGGLGELLSLFTMSMNGEPSRSVNPSIELHGMKCLDLNSYWALDAMSMNHDLPFTLSP